MMTLREARIRYQNCEAPTCPPGHEDIKVLLRLLDEARVEAAKEWHERQNLAHELDEARAQSGWRPIETAPKDTTQGDFLITLFNSRGDSCWVQIVRNPIHHHGMSIASHWMPMPEPPITDEGDVGNG